MTETTPVVAVKLRYSQRSYWFDPVLGDYIIGDTVLVETERGREVGQISAVGINATEEQLAALSSPLKPVIRLLDEKDIAMQERLQEKSDAALPLFRDLVEESGLEMKPVAVEYLFSGDKAVFYFASESRVDFRELVRELASRLHIRVELRQIGVRDEARMLGGISHCGERLCCARMGVDFQPVSIRMAKEQDLPLNPDKISGACGRLMCCLRYEFDTYRDFKDRAPKRGAEIDTPLGLATVTDYNTPRESVTMQLEDGKTFSILLSDFDEAISGQESDQRPASISREALEKSANANLILALLALDREGIVDELTPDYSTPTETRRRRGRREATDGAASANASENKGAVDASGAGGALSGTKDQSGRRPRQRSQAPQTPRRQDAQRAVNSKAGPSGQGQNDALAQTAQKDKSNTRSRSRSSLRPGRNSSGLRQKDASPAAATPAEGQAPRPSSGSSYDLRRRRRRQSRSDGE
ncbi:MAG: stage 0 sporulation family protein [Coriobacteriia bacterium]|nr:stage 0 sporulation family protein [Coriobacteriia bacterium]